MSVVYRMSDRRQLKIDNIIVSIAPLNYKVKADMQSMVLSGKPMDASVLAIRNSIKGIEGLKLADGSKYEINFDDDGQLSMECVEDLLNIPEASKLNLIAISLVNGMPQKEFMDPESGKPLDGVKFVEKAKAEKKTKARQ